MKEIVIPESEVITHQKLSEDHLKIHLKYTTRYEEVQKMEEQLQKLAEEVNNGKAQYVGWLNILAEEYNLEDGDAIDNDGKIIKGYKKNI